MDAKTTEQVEPKSFTEFSIALWKKAQDAFAYITLMRRGGRVKRFHTELLIGEETVAAHTYGVISWVMALTEGQASRNLILAALYHDTDEQILGDIPGPAKWYAPEVVDMVEQRQKQFRRDNKISIWLTEEELKVFMWADKFDLLMTCYDQQRMGNTVGSDMCKKITNKMDTLPPHELAERMLKMWLIRHPDHRNNDTQQGEYV